MRLHRGARLGPYEITAPIGAGGMGEVYKARDTRLDRVVAIKILPDTVADDPQRRERFRREAHAISSLTHPHICTLFDVGEDDGVEFLVMEYVAGETLEQRLRRGPLPIHDALQAAIEIADALDAAHRLGIVHRDLKPSNVMLTASGAKVLDFGLARDLNAEARALVAPAPPSTLTHAGTIVGTVQYMAPEQLEGGTADARSDIFAFGAIVYEMITGRRPFDGKSTVGVISAILTAAPAPIGELRPLTSPAFDRVVTKCLARDSGKRWQTAADLRDELMWIADGGQLQPVATRQSNVSTAGRRARFIGAAISGAALVALFGTSMAIGSRISGRQSLSAPEFTQVTFRRGFLAAARFASDGESVYYSASWDGRPFEIFSTRAHSPASTALGLSPGSVLAVSSTGELAILAGCDWRVVVGCDGTLARVASTGGAARELMEHVHWADWTPDGKQLAVVRVLDGMYRLEFPVGRVIHQVRVPGWIAHIRVSPRGDQIAFFESSVEPGEEPVASLSVIDVQGRKQNIQTGLGYSYGLAWSPGGDEIWFSSVLHKDEFAIYATTLAGHRRLVQRVPGGLVVYDIARNGTVLAGSYRHQGAVIGLVNGESQERDLSWFNGAFLGAITPDGRMLLFQDRPGGAGSQPFAVFVRKTDGSPPVKLLDEGFPLAFSPDGKSALVMVWGKTEELVVVPTGAGEARSLPHGDVEHWDAPASWLPDGKEILFSGQRKGERFRCFLQNLETGLVRAVTGEGVDKCVATPAGTSFVGTASAPRWTTAINELQGNASRAAIYQLQGRAPRAVPGMNEGDVPLQWSVDGRYLFVRKPPARNRPTPRGGPVEIDRLNTSTGRRESWRTLTPTDRAGVFVMDDPLITPDGRSYVYDYARFLHDLYVITGLK